MGFRICYLAAKCEPLQMARAFGLEVEETFLERPFGRWWVAQLAESGWSVLWSEKENYGARSQDAIAALSRQVDVIHCEVNETVMWSSAACWSNGELLWRITHVGGDEGVFDLTSEGKLPLYFAEIRDKHFAKQNEEDAEDEFSCDYVFEIPLDVANASIHFRHDGVANPEVVVGFHIIAPPKRAWLWSRLLGR